MANAVRAKNGPWRRDFHPKYAVNASMNNPGQERFSTCRQPPTTPRSTRKKSKRKPTNTSEPYNGSDCHSVISGRGWVSAGNKTCQYLNPFGLINVANQHPAAVATMALQRFRSR